MKSTNLNKKSATQLVHFSTEIKKTLISSLSPNFSYINKSGGIVYPIQCCLY